MTSETELLVEYEAKGILNGGELIVFKEFCTDFVSACRLAGLAITGIEGFYLLQDRFIKPNMEEIADFSGIKADELDRYIEECSDSANNFIRHMLLSGKSDGYCFTLTDSLSSEAYE